MPGMRRFLFVLLLAFTAFFGPGSVAQQVQGPIGEEHVVPIMAGGLSLDMRVQVFKPEGKGPFPTVIYLHGRAPNRTGRERIETAIPPGHDEWWLRKGVAVIAPVRPGYGATGGPDLEDTGARWRGAECLGEPDFMRVANATARPALVAYEWAQWQPWVKRDTILVEGYSLGGLGAMAVAAANPSGVRGVVNFSGGTAGNPIGAPGKSCRPDLMAQAYQELGRKARVPSLWLYAENDRYWGAQSPKQWHAAFREGGGAGELVVTPPVEGDGHLLLPDGPALWVPRLEAFIRKVGFIAGR